MMKPSAAATRRTSTVLPRTTSDTPSADTSTDGTSTPPLAAPLFAADGAGGGSSAVRVFVRVRPFSDGELRQAGSGGPTATVHCDASDPQLITILDPKNDLRSRETYAFERTFWSVAPSAAHGGAGSGNSPQVATQQDVFTHVGTPVLTNVLNGYNGCIFAYGQTGSGKTYTMMGLSEENPSVASPLVQSGHRPSINGPQAFAAAAAAAAAAGGPAKLSLGPSASSAARLSARPDDQGVIPRLTAAIFLALKEKHEVDKSHSFRIEVAYYEIYNEKVFDLLTSPSAAASSVVDHQQHMGELRVRLDPVNGPFVEGLTAHAVVDESAIARLLRKGTCARHVAATKMNDRSSRSHAIFSLHVTQMRLDDHSETVRTTSKLNLVDLAGSERTGQAGVEGIHFKESTRINLSLTTLGRVIDHLAEHGHVGVAPYRESQLTWLLMDSLGGNSKTTMVATISPSLPCYEEMLQTLRYASRAKQIVNKVVVNEDPQARRLKELEALVASLRTVIDQGGTNTYSNDYVDDLTSRLHDSQRAASELKNTVASLRCDVEQLQGQKRHLEAELAQEKENTARAHQMHAVAQVVKSRAAVPVLHGPATTAGVSARRNTGASPPKPALRGSVGQSGKPATVGAAPHPFQKQSSLTVTPRTATSSCCTSPRSGAPTPTPQDATAAPAASPVAAAATPAVLTPCPSLRVTSHLQQHGQKSPIKFERSADIPASHLLGELSTERLVEVVVQLRAALDTAQRDAKAHMVFSTIARTNEQVTVNDATKRILALNAKSSELSKTIQSHEVQHADYIKLIESLASDVEQGTAAVAVANKKVASLLEAQSKQAKDQLAAREAKERELLDDTLKKVLQDAKKSSAATLMGVEREVSTRVRNELKAQHEKAMLAAEQGFEQKIAQIRKSLSEQLAEERSKAEQDIASAKTRQEAVQLSDYSIVKSQLSQLQHQHAALAKARTADLAEMERARTFYDEEKRTLLGDNERRLLTLRREVEKSFAGKVHAAEEATRDAEALLKKKEVDHCESQKALRVCLEHEKEKALADAAATQKLLLDRKTDECKHAVQAIAQRDAANAELQRKVDAWEKTAQRQDEKLAEVRDTVATVMQRVTSEEAAHRAAIDALTAAHAAEAKERDASHAAALANATSTTDAAHRAFLREIEAEHDGALRNAVARHSRLEEELHCMQELLHVDAAELQSLQAAQAASARDAELADVGHQETVARSSVELDAQERTATLHSLCTRGMLQTDRLCAAMAAADVARQSLVGDESSARHAIATQRVCEGLFHDMVLTHAQHATAITLATEAAASAAAALLQAVRDKEAVRDSDAAAQQQHVATAIGSIAAMTQGLDTLQREQLEGYTQQSTQALHALLQLATQANMVLQATADAHLATHQNFQTEFAQATSALASILHARACELAIAQLGASEAARRVALHEAQAGERADLGTRQASSLRAIRLAFTTSAVEAHILLFSSCQQSLFAEGLHFARSVEAVQSQVSESMFQDAQERLASRIDVLERENAEYQDAAIGWKSDRVELTLRLREALDANRQMEILLDEQNLNSIERELVQKSKKGALATGRLGGFLNMFSSSSASSKPSTAAAAAASATAAASSSSGKENNDPFSASSLHRSVNGSAVVTPLDLSGLAASGASKLRTSSYYNFTPRNDGAGIGAAMLGGEPEVTFEARATGTPRTLGEESAASEEGNGGGARRRR